MRARIVIPAVLLAARCLMAQTPEPGTMTILYRFAGTGPNGCNPNGLILNDDGNFYGTTRGCGANNMGTVFKMTTGGQLTVLHSFTGGTDGALPVGPLTRDGAGNIYGVTTGESTTDNAIRQVPFASSVRIPADAIGEVNLYVAGTDAKGLPAQSKPVRLYVEVADGLRGLSVTPAKLDLSAFAPQQRFIVSGFFADGVTRDLSGAGVGHHLHHRRSSHRARQQGRAGHGPGER